MALRVRKVSVAQLVQQVLKDLLVRMAQAPRSQSKRVGLVLFTLGSHQSKRVMPALFTLVLKVLIKAGLDYGYSNSTKTRLGD